MKRYTATMYNLSYLTSMVYGLVFGIILFNESFSVLYFVGFGFVIAGSLIYNYYPTESEVTQLIEIDSILKPIE